MPYLKCTLPARPIESELAAAFSILTAAYQSVEFFFEMFEQIRHKRGARGTSRDTEQDLLRASLLFAAAGLDATVKQLVRDALRAVIQKNRGALLQFQEHVERRLHRPSPTGERQVDVKYIARMLVQVSPRSELEQDLVAKLTEGSLQSKDELLKVAANFAIPASELTNDLSRLRDIFNVRNEIAHEMDINSRRIAAGGSAGGMP